MTFRLVISILAGFFLLGGGGYAGYTYFTKPKPQTYIICAKDLKPCKDGVGVGRISPSCEFAMCPEDKPKGSAGINVLSLPSLTGSYTGTFEDIRGNGGDYQCDLADIDGAKGTIYASQGELRADFDPVVKPNVRSVPTHLILARATTYAWTDIAGSGVTFTRGMVGGDEYLKNTLPIDPTIPHAFTCTASARDASRFAPPSTVSFKDKNPHEATSTLE